jgi:hypothetical protein
LITEDPQTLSSISNRIDEGKSDVKSALGQINIQLAKGVISKKARELLK